MGRLPQLKPQLLRVVTSRAGEDRKWRQGEGKMIKEMVV